MKLIKNSIIVFAVFLFYGCAQIPSLQKTMWVNASPSNNENSTLVLTSLEFLSDNNVDIYNAVIDNDKVLVTAFKYAEGSYNLSKNKKNTLVDICALNIKGDSIKYQGIYHKKKAIILEYGNKSIKTFGKTSVKLP